MDAIDRIDGNLSAFAARAATLAAMRDLTQDFLVRFGAVLIDPEKIAGCQQAVANFRHDLRAKLSVLDTLVGSIDRAEQDRDEAIACLAVADNDLDRLTAAQKQSRSERRIDDVCSDVPDLLDEFAPTAPPIDDALTLAYPQLVASLSSLGHGLAT